MRYPYQSLAAQVLFAAEAVKPEQRTWKLHAIAKGLGYNCGTTMVKKARRMAVQQRNLAKPLETGEDDWTVPCEGQSAIKQVIESKTAPSHGNQWQRFMAGFDVHGDQQNVEANAAFFRHVDMFQPELRIMGGDLWDFRPLRNGVSSEEKQESMARDYLAGLQWLQRFQPQHFLRGNHDERLWEWAFSKRGIEQDFARGKVEHIESEVEKMNCKIYPYHVIEGILQIGSLQVAHGFYNGMNCAKQMATDYGCIIFGHNHCIQSMPVSGLKRKAARCMGSLCNNIMPYNERRPSALRHANGWGYGVIHREKGTYHVWQAEKIEDVWMVPSDVVEL